MCTGETNTTLINVFCTVWSLFMMCCGVLFKPAGGSIVKVALNGCSGYLFRVDLPDFLAKNLVFFGRF